MKQEKNIEKKVPKQSRWTSGRDDEEIRQGIKDAFAGTRVELNQMNLKVTATNGDFNIFLNQNIGKGPPGRTRSPVAARGHPPAGKARPPENKAGPPDSNSYDYNEVQLISINTKFNLLQTFNLLIMKKQILILVLFVLAAFASVNKSYGQSVHGSEPLPLSCTNDALHPIAGKTYPYTVAATPTGGQYTWWATKDGTFYDASLSYAANLAGRLTTPVGLLSADAAYGATSAAATVNISWSSATLSATGYQNSGGKTSTFVAVHYTPPVGSDCADNFKVFELDPKNGFTVDILNLDPVLKTPVGSNQAVYTFNATECFANVTAATYNAGKMDYLYGVNTMYFEVVASNFSGSWTPTFQLTGLQGTQSAVIEWDYTNAFGAPVTVTSGTPSATAITTTAGLATDLGVSIYVRVTITNHSFEGLANTPIALAVDGTDAAGNLDVINSTCVTPAAADFVDVATQTLNKRPTVIEGTSSLIPTDAGIIPKNP